MEKIARYEQIVCDLLKEWAQIPDVDHVLIDTQNHHYQWLRAGYDNRNRYFFRVRMHFSINAEGKICILENQTDIEVGDDLMEKGVPKSDILPAFLPAEARKLVGYA